MMNSNNGMHMIEMVVAFRILQNIQQFMYLFIMIKSMADFCYNGSDKNSFKNHQGR